MFFNSLILFNFVAISVLRPISIVLLNTVLSPFPVLSTAASFASSEQPIRLHSTYLQNCHVHKGNFTHGAECREPFFLLTTTEEKLTEAELQLNIPEYIFADANVPGSIIFIFKHPLLRQTSLHSSLPQPSLRFSNSTSHLNVAVCQHIPLTLYHLHLRNLAAIVE